MIPALHQVDYAVLKIATDLVGSSDAYLLPVYLLAEMLIFVMGFYVYALWRFPRIITGKVHKEIGAHKAVVMTCMSLLLALGVKSLVNFAVFRSRPFISHPDLNHLFLHVDPASFPSGHTLIAFTIAASVYFSGFKTQGKILYIMAFLVGLGRILAGVHYPSDVLAGAVLGIASAWYLHREGSMLKRYLPNHY